MWDFFCSDSSKNGWLLGFGEAGGESQSLLSLTAGVGAPSLYTTPAGVLWMMLGRPSFEASCPVGYVGWSLLSSSLKLCEEEEREPFMPCEDIFRVYS